MKKFALAVCVLFCFLQLNAQVDTSFYYYNIFGESTEKGATDIHVTRKVYWQNMWFVNDYYTNGKPMKKIQYKDFAYELAQDTLYEYHENGQLANKGAYNNGHKLVFGLVGLMMVNPIRNAHTKTIVHPNVCTTIIMVKQVRWLNTYTIPPCLKHACGIQQVYRQQTNTWLFHQHYMALKMVGKDS